jgi:hypothetical protein
VDGSPCLGAGAAVHKRTQFFLHGAYNGVEAGTRGRLFADDGKVNGTPRFRTRFAVDGEGKFLLNCTDGGI